MHAATRVHGPGEPSRGIRGTFYPARSEDRSMGAAIPKLILIVVAIGVVRSIAGAKRHHREGSPWSRRREAIAQLHRELHAGDDAAEAKP